MMRRLVILMAILSVGLVSPASHAVDFLLPSPLPIPNADYETRLLQVAIDHMDGDHRLELVDANGHQTRALRTLADGKAPFNVQYSGYSREREKMLRLIPIPLTRGLLGYRALITQKTAAPTFDGPVTIQAVISKVSLAVGGSWPDKNILRAAGFQIVAGGDIWEMLSRGRVTAIPMGLDEITTHFNSIDRDPRYQNQFMIAPEPVIAYKYDSFFFVAADDQLRASLIEQGLKRAYESGAFMDLFETYPSISAGLELVEKNRATVIRIKNRDMSSRIRQIPAKYWHQF